MRRPAWLLLALLGLFGCRRAPRTVLVFAASSTTDALQRLGADFGRERGVQVDFSFAGSSTLARQLEAGAPADLFLSADRAQLEKLKAAGGVETDRPLLGNRLVVVAPRGASPLSSGCALAGFRRVALADPQSVPAGVYARAWLTSLGCWEKVAPKVVPALNVRAAMAQVESGAVPLGVVYATDAALSPGLQVVLAVSGQEAPSIVYPLALTRHGARSQDARDFYSYLFSPRAQAAFERLGFTPPGH